MKIDINDQQMAPLLYLNLTTDGMKIRKIIFAFVLILTHASLFAQSDTVNLGSSTTFYLGEQASFYFGGNTGFNGTINNQGTIIANRNLNFVDNKEVGNLRFVGAGDQEVFGDTLVVSNLEVQKPLGRVKVMTTQILVEGNLDVTQGAIETDDIDDLIVTGQSQDDGEGYVLGKLVGLTAGQPVTFPMGIEINGQGFPNYITFSNTRDGIVLIVDCLDEPGTLLPSDEMVGIADQIEWIVRTREDSTEATISVDFSGIDFVNFSNGEEIKADIYEPALVVLQKGDTIFQILEPETVTPSNVASGSTQSEGSIVRTSSIMINTDSTRLALAWIPLVNPDKVRVFVPNAFAPNGIYEENRVFRPFYNGEDMTSISFRVFSAYNDEVYSYAESANNIDLSLIGWDGNLRTGQPAEEGVYYYSLSVIRGGIAEKFESTVLLVR